MIGPTKVGPNSAASLAGYTEVYMAIFARLVSMLFAIPLCMGLSAGIYANSFSDDKTGTLMFAAGGAFLGVFIGKWLGNIVVGKPPKD